MPLQLQNRWRENTHHYVRWSDDSRQVIRLYKPRLQQQLVLSPRCGHLKGNGGVKAVTADSNSISFGKLCRSEIEHHRHSKDTGQCAIGTRGGGGGNTSVLDLLNAPFTEYPTINKARSRSCTVVPSRNRLDIARSRKLAFLIISA